DGPRVGCAGHDAHFVGLCRTVGRPELADDPRFATPDLRRQHADDIERELVAALRARSAAEWLERFEAEGIPCAPINSVADAVKNPQVAARNMVVGIPAPAIGTLLVAGHAHKI